VRLVEYRIAFRELQLLDLDLRLFSVAASLKGDYEILSMSLTHTLTPLLLFSCERVLVEVSNRARLDLRSCQLGSNLHVHGSIIGKVNGGCDGGGVLIRHTGTSARIHKCLVTHMHLTILLNKKMLCNVVLFRAEIMLGVFNSTRSVRRAKWRSTCFGPHTSFSRPNFWPLYI
jgi:hypothetical protein